MASGRVLIVDDDRDSLAYLDNIISGAGYTVETLSQGSEVVARMQAEPPDMVFLDIQMPRMNGFQVLKAIRETEGLAETPVILFSAISSVTGETYDPDKIQKQYGVRPDGFMSKAIEPEAVRKQLAALATSTAAQ